MIMWLFWDPGPSRVARGQKIWKHESGASKQLSPSASVPLHGVGETPGRWRRGLRAYGFELWAPPLRTEPACVGGYESCAAPGLARMLGFWRHGRLQLGAATARASETSNNRTQAPCFDEKIACKQNSMFCACGEVDNCDCRVKKNQPTRLFSSFLFLVQVRY